MKLHDVLEFMTVNELKQLRGKQVQKLVQICLSADMTDLVEPAHRLLGELAMVLAEQRRLDDCAWLQHGLTMRGAFPILLQALALSWLGKRPAAEMQSALADGARQAAATGEVARVLGEAGLRVPVSAKAWLLQALAAVAPILTVHSDIGGGENAAETVAADPRPHLHLSPLDAGLSAELQVNPLGDSGPQLHPGEGRATLFAERAGHHRGDRRHSGRRQRRLGGLAQAPGGDA